MEPFHAVSHLLLKVVVAIVEVEAMENVQFSSDMQLNLEIRFSYEYISISMGSREQSTPRICTMNYLLEKHVSVAVALQPFLTELQRKSCTIGITNSALMDSLSGS